MNITIDTVLLVTYAFLCGIALRTLWLIHQPLAVALTALFLAGARWADATNREPNIMRELEKR